MTSRSNKITEQALGRKLRMYRVINGYKIINIAELLSISPQQVFKYEQGIDQISATKLRLLSEKLKVPLNLFFDSEINQQEIANIITEQDYSILKSFKAIENQSIQQCLENFIANLALVYKCESTNN